MTPHAEAISTYNFQSSERLLLDTNVWLLIYGFQKPNDQRVDIYSQAFKKILASKCPIYIDVLIVSEFINTCARSKWNLLPEHSKPKDFKRFRKSPTFKSVGKGIAVAVKKVLQHCTRVESGFESLAIDTSIDEYAAGNSDFNDQVIASLCSREGLKLVTDDSDFKGQDIPIITANRRLLT